MFEPRLSAAKFGVLFIVIVFLSIGFALGVGAQGPDDGESTELPEKVTVVEEVELLDFPTSPNLATYFKRLSANVFVPYDDNMTYNYGGAGCVYRTGGTNYSDHALQLPQGAEIDYLRVYFYDNDSVNDARAILFAYDGLGYATNIVSVSSTGTPGQSSAGVGAFSHTVDNVGEALAVRLNYESGDDSDLKICGVRIRYQYSLSSLSIPVLLNETNP